MSGELKRRWLGPVAVALAVLAAACGGDDGGDDGEAAASSRRSTTTTEDATTTTTEATTTTAAAPTTTTTKAPDPNSEEAVLVDYRRGWDGVMSAITANPPDPDFPLLVRLHRGLSLQHWRDLAVQIRDSRWVVRGDIELRPRIESFDGTRAVVHDCYIDRAEFVVAKTGEV